MDERLIRAAVFESTEKFCKENAKLQENVIKSVSMQKLILEGDEIPELDKKIYEKPAEVLVSAKRTFEAASAYKDRKVSALNFASATTPGGGVRTGAGAQEECLCRTSNLYFCLNREEMWDGFYGPHRAAKNPLHNDDIIYTPNVTVFKTDEAWPKLMPEEEWYEVNVITCAAPNLRPRPCNGYNKADGERVAKMTDEELLALFEKRLRRILDVALMEGDEVVILGAFGCGAFMNRPEIVAMASKNVLPEYLHAFKTIEFAVYCKPGYSGNYDVFKSELG